MSVAWGVGKKKSGGPLFVLRGGYGLFYDRLTLGSQENTVQEERHQSDSVDSRQSDAVSYLFDDGHERMRRYGDDGSPDQADDTAELPLAVPDAGQHWSGYLAVQECDDVVQLPRMCAACIN